MALHVRPLLNEEGKRLSRTARKTNNAITLRRAKVILHSAQGFTPPKIADMLGQSVEWTRHIILMRIFSTLPYDPNISSNFLRV